MKIRLEVLISWLLMEAHKAGKYSIRTDDVRLLAKRLEEKAKEEKIKLKVAFTNDDLTYTLKKHEREFIESFGEISAFMGVGCVRGYLVITSYFVHKPNTYSLLLVYIGNIYGRGAEMNLKKTRKILLLGTLLSLLFTFSAYATEYTATAGVNTAFTGEHVY